MHLFSASSRSSLFSGQHPGTADVLVIGGGITGAGIALDAASRGLRVVLIEKGDFASGTSSRSTKLIHGGLRYLKQGDLGLVKEVGRERAVVHRNARHLVIPEKMLLPVVKGGSLSWPLAAVGLWVYDRLAGVGKSESRQMLNRQTTIAAEPMLHTENIKGGALYYEYRTDDARLTLEVLKTAAEYGAVAANYTEATGFIYNQEQKIEAVEVKDTLTGTTAVLYARQVVNATGPWVDDLRKMDPKGTPARPAKRLHLTKGVHIVVPYDRLPLQQSVYFDTEGGRMVFAIPRGKTTYIGTTDTHFTGDTDEPQVEEADITYLLAAANAMFPTAGLSRSDMVSGWAGLRPLIHQEGRSPSDLSRKDEIFVSTTGLISIAGGKLTGYRKMAERVVDKVIHNSGANKIKCQTATLSLSGNFAPEEDIDKYTVRRAGEARQIGLGYETIAAWVSRYGVASELLIERAFEICRETETPAELAIKTEVWYAVHSEMSCTLSDILIRRTGKLYFDSLKLQEEIPLFASAMASELNWSPQQIKNNIAAFYKDATPWVVSTESSVV